MLIKKKANRKWSNDFKNMLVIVKIVMKPKVMQASETLSDTNLPLNLATLTIPVILVALSEVDVCKEIHSLNVVTFSNALVV